MKINIIRDIPRAAAQGPIIFVSVAGALITAATYLFINPGQRPESLMFGGFSTIGYWILLNFAFDRAREANCLNDAVNEELVSVLLAIFGLLFLLFIVNDEHDRLATTICYYAAWIFLVVYLFEVVVASIAAILLQDPVARQIKRFCEQ
jgi:hypothetical protein